MKKLYKDAYYALVSMILMAKAWIGEKAYKLQTEGASHFVEILVAIIIVIAVGAIFKNQIINFINTIVGTSTTNAQALF